ncbi:MAG: exosome complex protein Rrp42 [Candidatus Hodarchaeota archaeon]
MFHAEQLVGVVEKKHMLSLLKSGKRIDGRQFDEMRDVEIELGVIKKADGSALVKLGRTTVIAGVKSEIGTPFPDTPDRGVLTVNIELSPMASPAFESGPPRKEAIELARVVDRSIRESKAVPLDKTCLVPEKHVWILFIDIYAMDHFGNFFDVSCIAAMAAVLDTRLKKPIIDENDPENITLTEEKEPVPVEHFPVSLTFAKIDNYILLDPCLEEERCAEARFTVTFTEEGKICACQKGATGTFTREEIYTMVDIAEQKAPFIIKKLRELRTSN